jgi:hypothetical protein
MAIVSILVGRREERGMDSHMRNARNVMSVMGCALSLQFNSPGVALMSAILRSMFDQQCAMWSTRIRKIAAATSQIGLTKLRARTLGLSNPVTGFLRRIGAGSSTRIAM